MSVAVRIFTWMLPPIFEIGLQHVLKKQDRYMYVGTYHDVQALQAAFDKENSIVDILIMDYQLAFTSYPKFLTTLRQGNDRLRVLFILPTVLDENVLVHALRSGGDGYLLQCVEAQVLLDAVEKIVNGRAYIDSQMTPAVLEELRKPAHTMREFDVRVQLSDREQLLVQLAADGLSNVQIGEVLGLAEKTVRNLWSSLFDKVGFSDRTQTVLWAIRTGQAELR